jgi:hypothetical protein
MKTVILILSEIVFSVPGVSGVQGTVLGFGVSGNEQPGFKTGI